MKIAAVTAAALLMAAGAQGKSGTERQVTVFMDNSDLVPFFVRLQAERLASHMFAEIGVTLNWQSSDPGIGNRRSSIEFVDRHPSRPSARRMGLRAPIRRRSHLEIFWDRMQFAESPRELLAHVMVHEITHILQGITPALCRGHHEASLDGTGAISSGAQAPSLH